MRHDWGYAFSPILHRGKVILNFGPGARTFLAALDLKTGELLWKRDEPGGLDATDKRMVGSWSTPIIIQVGGKDQILCSMPARVIACDPESGSLLWFCAGLADEKVLWTVRLDGGESWGSVVLAAGQLYVTSRSGVTTVFRPDPAKLEVLAMNDLGEPSHATPAISDGQIFLRTDQHLYCIAED